MNDISTLNIEMAFSGTVAELTFFFLFFGRRMGKAKNENRREKAGITAYA